MHNIYYITYIKTTHYYVSRREKRTHLQMLHLYISYIDVDQCFTMFCMS